MGIRGSRGTAALVLVVGAMACPGTRESRVFILDDAVKMSADGRILSLVDLGDYRASNAAWDGHAITLEGARRETVSVQVSGLRCDQGNLGAEQFALYREWYLPVTVKSTSPGGSAGLGEYPDALIPASAPGWGLPIDVAPGRTQGIWVDLAIPAEARSGTCRGALVVSAAERTVARFDLTLTVHDFAIPVERHLRWRIGYSGWEAVPEHFKVAEGSAEWLRLEQDL